MLLYKVMAGICPFHHLALPPIDPPWMVQIIGTQPFHHQLLIDYPLTEESLSSYLPPIIDCVDYPFTSEKQSLSL